MEDPEEKLSESIRLVANYLAGVFPSLQKHLEQVQRCLQSLTTRPYSAQHYRTNFRDECFIDFVLEVKAFHFLFGTFYHFI